MTAKTARSGESTKRLKEKAMSDNTCLHWISHTKYSQTEHLAGSWETRGGSTHACRLYGYHGNKKPKRPNSSILQMFLLQQSFSIRIGLSSIHICSCSTSTKISHPPNQGPLHQNLDDVLSYCRQVTRADQKDQQEPWSKELKYNYPLGKNNILWEKMSFCK